MTFAIAGLKKPHRHFNLGDLVVGERRDGGADSLVCWGWSSKHNRIVGGKRGYRMRYCGWEALPKRFMKAAQSAKMDRPEQWLLHAPNGSGHLRIMKWIDGELGDDSPQLRDEAWLRRLLIENSCGNMPLSRREAASSRRFFTQKSPPP